MEDQSTDWSIFCWPTDQSTSIRSVGVVGFNIVVINTLKFISIHFFLSFLSAFNSFICLESLFIIRIYKM